ncbi:adenylosuccinate synthase [Paenibacillus sp. OV219]|uniref:adenylosuccinate synthase n=1 Tax=Paenibacillus sp. OV219 TaxID=1884377 RepID=UPI0008B57622|nr:adenylosuccinate synthase [Paenibacillus sp. OV219]SEM73097.1 Adenylosuccinate synthetase [Paenibacillus sp. OV219]
MPVTAIVGANWGDEGKGKMTDVLAAHSSFVVRYQGGSNAGHTIINEYGKFALHMLPSGVFYPHVTNVIGPGTALDADVLLQELQQLEDRGVPKPSVFISDRTQLVMPYHRLFDQLEEERLGSLSFGSTRRGIAPFYADKYAKLGIQAAELFEPARLRSRLSQSLAAKNVLLEHLYGMPPIDLEALLLELNEYAAKLQPYLLNTTELLHRANQSGASILVEGQLGALRDPDHGIYPYSTSSSTLAGFASVGAGIPPGSIERVIAVVKAYSSCVGAGPFISEITGEEANALRLRGGDAGEFGATTGRPRRMGWFDAVATRYGCMVQGATELALTNLDVLGYLEAIPVCSAYRLANGTITQEFPVNAKLEGAEPVLSKLPGWSCDISGVREFDQLPPNAISYVEWMEQAIGIRIGSISVGPHRDQLIKR